MCDEVHQTLHHECRLGSPSAAIGRVGRFVGGDDSNRDVVVGYVIGAEQVDGGIDGRADADRHVSARILQQTVAAGRIILGDDTTALDRHPSVTVIVEAVAAASMPTMGASDSIWSSTSAAASSAK